jgi:SAM-dependent methyltransferase
MHSCTDDWNRHWRSYAESAARNPAQKYRRRLILALLSANGHPQRVLDLGAGTGDLAHSIRQSFPDAEILGLDVSAEGLEVARHKVPDAVFLERDLLQAGSAPREFRGWASHAVCSEVLEHVDDPERLLANAIPYLAPGCLVVVTVPGGPMSAFDRHIGHRRHYQPAQLQELLERVALVPECATGAGFPFFNLYRLVVVLRGRRLIEDAGAGSTGITARAAMRLFGLLFRLNADASPWGWQTIARARLSN